MLEQEAYLDGWLEFGRELFRTEVASVETSYREQLGERESVLADRIVAAEQQARETAEELASSKAALDATSERSEERRVGKERRSERQTATCEESERLEAERAER